MHLYGRAVDILTVREVAEKYSLKIIEDSAQAHGAEFHGIKTGCLGDAAAFSFIREKFRSTGRCRCSSDNDEELAGKIRAYGNYGSYEKYNHVYQGCNSRLDEYQAAF